MKSSAALFCLLVGCSADATPAYDMHGPIPVPRVIPEGCTDGLHWVQRPVLFNIDADMPAECLFSVYESLYWWETQGVDYLVPVELPGSSEAFKEMYGGQIFIHMEDLTPPVVGNTGIQYHGNEVLTAGIGLESCSAGVIAHEIGHSLGLMAHNPSKGFLMYPSTDGIALKLSTCEKAQVQ